MTVVTASRRLDWTSGIYACTAIAYWYQVTPAGVFYLFVFRRWATHFPIRDYHGHNLVEGMAEQVLDIPDGVKSYVKKRAGELENTVVQMLLIISSDSGRNVCYDSSLS